MPETNTQFIPYEDMLKAGMHFGRKKTVFNPGMGNYVFSVRDGICIIDLLKTQDLLNQSIAFLKEVKEGGGLILCMAPTKQSRDGVLQLAQAMGMPYVLDRWLGGTLTNFKIINTRVKRLEEMEQQKASDALDKYTKKERLLFDRELEKMKKSFEGLKKLTRIPDVLFVASLKDGALPIHEARRMGVRIIAIANTDASPEGVQYVIPANDRSKKSIDLIVDAIQKALTA